MNMLDELVRWVNLLSNKFEVTAECVKKDLEITWRHEGVSLLNATQALYVDNVYKQLEYESNKSLLTSR